MFGYYMRVVINFVLIALCYGIVGPWLISQPDDFLFVTGVIVCLLIGPWLLWAINRKFVSNAIKMIKENQ